MGLQGRRIENDYPIEQFIEIIHECGGRVKNMAHKTGYSQKAIYDYLDIYPELQEARKVASHRQQDHGVETGQEIMETLMDMVQSEPGQAYKAAAFLLKNTKHSPFFDEPKGDGVDNEKVDQWFGNLKKYVRGRIEHKDEDE